MLLGWLVVAILEWAAWRGEPHYGSGLPPRYYVPKVNLPPAQPLEQVRVGYPEAQRDEAPTWIASAALREEVLGEWPHAAPLPVELPAEPEAEQSDRTRSRGPRSCSRPSSMKIPSLEPEPAAAGPPAAGTEAVAGGASRGEGLRATASTRWAIRRLAGGSAAAERTSRRRSTSRPVRQGPRALPGRANRQE